MSFTESLALKVVSLLLALILWITILGFKREEMRKSVKFEPMLPPGKVLLNRIPTHIQFTFVGPRVLLKDVEKRMQPIRPDLKATRESKVDLSIKDELLDELPANVKVTAVQPPNIVLRFDELVELKRPVRANLVGSVPEGYSLASVTVTPSQVSVTGPKTVIESLDALSTEPIQIDDLTNSVTREVTVQLHSDLGLHVVREQIVKVNLKIRKTK